MAARETQKRHLIFDLDGTILDSRDEILKTYKRVFGEIPPGVVPDMGSLNLGLTIGDLLLTIYGNDQKKIDAAKKLFMSVYDNSDYSATHLYEGVPATLAALQAGGFQMYIATNKRLTPTLRILTAKHVDHFFYGVMANEMQAGVTLTKRQMIAGLKEMGSFTEGYIVGDSITDMTAGKDEKLITIAVNYGYEHKGKLAAMEPAYSIDSIDELLELLL